VYTSQLITGLSYCSCHFYADDTQLYYSAYPVNVDQAVQHINNDLKCIAELSYRHCLEINPLKSKALLFGPSYLQRKYANNIKLTLKGCAIPMVMSAKYLGLAIDADLKFSEHISMCIRRAFANLKLIYSHRNALPRNMKKLLCDSLVLSHFNYANVVYGPCLLARDRDRLVAGIRARETGVARALRNLEWLRMDERRTLHLYQSINQKSSFIVGNLKSLTKP